MRWPVAILTLFFILSSGFVCAQTTSPKAGAEPALATLTTTPDKTVFKMGEAIGVTLTLEAGPHGVFVSKWSMQTCSHGDWRDVGCGRHIYNLSGFDVGVYTLAGKYASPMGHGGAADRFGPPPSPKEEFEKYFEFLQPGEEVKWHNIAEDGSPAKPGDYEVVGEYIPDDPQLADMAKLPESRGLLIAKTIKSAPVIITVVK